MSARQQARVSPAKLALAVKQLHSAQESLDLIASDPIAIVGMGCRFPGGADSPEAFWEALRTGRDCVGEVPVDRWKDSGQLDHAIRLGAYLAEIDGFDAEYFGISPREARLMDPQQRLLLEVVWESLWDAGMEPCGLSGGDAGVFAAIYNGDYARMYFRDNATLTAQGGIGTAHSIAAGRLSFLLDVRGPSLALDSACSSSLVAVHMACRSLRARECGLAIVAASSLKVLSDEVRVFSKWGMLASDGKCKTFDAAADGFVPGEGAGALVLKRLSDAIEQGDRVHAVIRGTAVNHDGRTTVLTAPNGLAQQDVLRAALKNAMIAPHEVGYIETHGTGTSLGDPIEVEAIGAVYGQPQDADGRPLSPCLLGAVKTNLGHLEAAAGMAGMIKTALCMRHGEVPKNLHFQRLNPEISLDGSRLKIATERVPWPRGSAPRVAGISSFGLGGTNAHIVVEEAPAFSAREGRTIPLPARPWRRQRFWMQEPEAARRADASASATSLTLHPLLGERMESPFVSGVLYGVHLDSGAVPWLAEHGLGRHVLVPFAAFLEMSSAAVSATNGSGSVALHQFTVGEPLFVPPAGCRVQAHVAGDSVEIASASSSEWKTNARATIGLSSAAPDRLDLSALRARCTKEVPTEELYRGLERTGLRYGASFRTLQSVWRGQQECVSHLLLPGNPQMDADRYGLHPTLLDGCLQTVAAARKNFGEDLFLPIGVDRFEQRRRGVCELWVHTTVVKETAEAVVANIAIADREGEIAARLFGFTAKRTSPKVLQEKFAQKTEAGLVHALAWRSCERAKSADAMAGGNWLLVESRPGNAAGLVKEITARGAACTVVRDAEFHSTQFETAPWDGIVYDARDMKDKGLDLPWAHAEQSSIAFALELGRLLSAWRGASPRLRILSRGAFAVLPAEDVRLERAPLFGLVRSLGREFPEASPIWIDLDRTDGGTGGEAEEQEELLAKEITGLDEDPVVAYRAGRRYAARLVREDTEEALPERLQFSLSGLLEDVSLAPTARSEPRPGEIEIAVHAAGLNFRDVLTAMGMLAERSPIPGAECSGTVARVGDGVRGFRPGDAVVAFAPSSLQSFVNVPAEFAVPKPPKMTFAEAAGIPVAFLTALYGLERLAKLAPGQTVLVHAAAGGLGMAAVQLALRAGGEVYATAGTEEKRALVKRLGAKQVFDSRSLGFREGVLEATGGRGVDVVLNSLAGDFLNASFDVVARGGVFLEAGKRGIWSAEEVAALGKSIRYFPFDLGDVAIDFPASIATMMRELMQRLEEGGLTPLPAALYSLKDPATAFRTMAQARHTGKIVLGVKDELAPFDWKEMLPAGTVLIAGGLGALGWETALWLAARGARNMVLAGRSADATVENAAIAELRRQGGRIALERCNVADPEQVRDLLAGVRATMPPLCAVFHAAGVSRDKVLLHESWDSYREAVAAKIDGAWNLHCLTAADPVRLMVFYSSAASVLGSAGQASYAAANAFLDALAHFRVARGQRTLSVNWGAWAAAGMAARLSPERAARWSRLGAGAMEAADALRALDRAITAGRTQAAILDMDWRQFVASRSAQADVQFLGEVLGQGHTEQGPVGPVVQRSGTPELPGVAARIRSAAPADRGALLRVYLKKSARKTLGLAVEAGIAEDVPLQEIGLDSLMALEMRNDLAQSLNVALPAGLLFDYPSIGQLTQELLRALAADSPTPESRNMRDSEEHLPLESLSDEEAERLLVEELDRAVREKANA